MSVPPVPHPLSERQKEVLLYLLRHERPGYQQLREQVPSATVVRYWGEVDPGFDIAVAQDAPKADLQDGLHADAEWGWTESGEAEGNLIVWVEAGLLSALEYGWVSDDVPQSLPPPERIREPPPGE